MKASDRVDRRHELERVERDLERLAADEPAARLRSPCRPRSSSSCAEAAELYSPACFVDGDDLDARRSLCGACRIAIARHRRSSWVPFVTCRRGRRRRRASWPPPSFSWYCARDVVGDLLRHLRRRAAVPASRTTSRRRARRVGRGRTTSDDEPDERGDDDDGEDRRRSTTEAPRVAAGSAFDASWLRRRPGSTERVPGPVVGLVARSRRAPSAVTSSSPVARLSVAVLSSLRVVHDLRPDVSSRPVDLRLARSPARRAAGRGRRRRSPSSRGRRRRSPRPCPCCSRIRL